MGIFGRHTARSEQSAPERIVVREQLRSFEPREDSSPEGIVARERLRACGRVEDHPFLNERNDLELSDVWGESYRCRVVQNADQKEV